jgi:hypothetical protein
MLRNRIRHGKVIIGKGDDKGVWIECPNCKMRFDKNKISKTDDWHVVTSTDAATPYTQSIEVQGGCPFCGLGAY